MSDETDDDGVTAEQRVVGERVVLTSNAILLLVTEKLVVHGAISKREALAAMAMAMGKFFAIGRSLDSGMPDFDVLWPSIPGIVKEAMEYEEKRLREGKPR